jgi:predicted XRE-type DNA-binding protein
MKIIKRHRLEKAGWKVGAASDFLGLSAEESAFIELKLVLARELHRLRNSQSMTQTEIAKRLRTSQSRIAKMEAAEASVSVDLLIRALLALGASRKSLGRVLASRGGRHAA